jgi:hypothetical protein
MKSNFASTSLAFTEHGDDEHDWTDSARDLADPNRGHRPLIHGLLALSADAGFVATAAITPGDVRTAVFRIPPTGARTERLRSRRWVWPRRAT